VKKKSKLVEKAVGGEQGTLDGVLGPISDLDRRWDGLLA